MSKSADRLCGERDAIDLIGAQRLARGADLVIIRSMITAPPSAKSNGRIGEPIPVGAFAYFGDTKLEQKPDEPLVVFEARAVAAAEAWKMFGRNENDQIN
jgi:hypothetical protein